MSVNVIDSVFLRPQQVAKILSVTRVTLWRWAKKGILPKPIKLGPNVSGWTAADIHAFIESRRKANGSGN